MSDLLQQLLAVIPNERILSRYIDRVAYSSDAGFYSLLPAVIVRPDSDFEIKHILSVAHSFDISVTFRTGGTSLSGQSVTDGILVDLTQFWKNMEISDNGNLVRLQPGVIGSYVNARLKPFRRKIGPDPASIQSAHIGGILANNSSGMCCGVLQNAYHTLHSLSFILADGSQFNSSDNEDRIRFSDSPLGKDLTSLRRQILENETLVSLIREKYQLKNTVGYGLNSLVDFSAPIDIFSHLLIGSEGTLGFISEAILKTIPDHPNKLTGLLYFRNLHDACQSIQPLKNIGAAALELMDYASLKSVAHHEGVPPELKTLPEGYCGLLIEFQEESLKAIQDKMETLIPVVNQLEFQLSVRFTIDPDEQAALWKIRRGLLPSVGAVRKSGTSVIIEDIVFPIEHLADAVVRLHDLFKKHDYNEAIIFGHAKDGNIHFVITQSFSGDTAIRQYKLFLDDVVDLVVRRFHGSLKGEHGTGRNISPFVETEWGSDAYLIMKTVKSIADPNKILNRGVLINPDHLNHVKNLKSLPSIELEADKCMECGFCEPHCPSNNLTLTPRQRIMVRREMVRLENSHNNETSSHQLSQLVSDFEYSGIETCATDGLCATHCPVGIDTGKVVKQLRYEQHSAFSTRISKWTASNFSLVEKFVTLGLKSGHILNRLLGSSTMHQLTLLSHELFPSLPVWMNSMPTSGTPSKNLTNANPSFLYFPTCISRNMGGYEGEYSVSQTIGLLAFRSGISIQSVSLPNGFCCGTPFSSKGYFDAYRITINKTIYMLCQESNNGEIPILVDTSPCTFSFKNCYNDLTSENQIKYKTLKFIDSIEFINQHLLPKLTVSHKLNSIVLHSVCSATKLNLTKQLDSIGEICANTIHQPMNGKCCGMAGDRGLLFPELTDSAAKEAAESLKSLSVEGCFSSSRMCEASLSEQTGKSFHSLFHLVEKITR